MTTEERDSARKRLTAIVREVKEQFGYRRSAAIEEIADRFSRSSDRRAALVIAADRLYGETERLSRSEGLRPGYKVARNGQIYSLGLLDLAFREARDCVRIELTHARSALVQGEWDRYLLGVCEERARERGIDPDVTDLLLSAFIETDEAKALYREWQQRWGSAA